jgi:hypothetical protein
MMIPEKDGLQVCLDDDDRSFDQPRASRVRIELSSLLAQGENEGAEVLLRGAVATVQGHGGGPLISSRHRKGHQK